MTDSDPDPFKPLRRGLLELALLSLLAGGRLYAAEIIQRLEGTVFATQEGTLYPLLGKLRREGLLDHEWEESESGPPRKYHRLTPAGEQHLAGLTGYWKTLTTTIEDLGAPR